MNNQQDSLEVVAIAGMAFFFSLILSVFTWL